MVHSRPITAGYAVEQNDKTPQNYPVTQLRERPALRAVQATRRYDISCFLPNGDTTCFTRTAPALPLFEDAFTAVAQGTIIATENGPVAIEDLRPGTHVQTVENGAQPVLWIGGTTLVSGARGQPEEMGHLTRIAADSFGLGRPMPDLLLGPGARLLYRSNALGSVLAPAAGFVDGECVIRSTSVSPLRVFHLAFARHQIIRANGVEIESYHPGTPTDMRMNRELLALFLTLFPHCQSLDSFGPAAYQRLSVEETQGRRVL